MGGNTSYKQLSIKEKVSQFHKSSEGVIEFFNDYFKMEHKAAYDVKQLEDSKY